MNPVEFSQRFAQAPAGSPEAASLARDLAEDARFPARLALRSLSSADPGEKDKSQYSMDLLRELALTPLAASPSFQEIDTEIWTMRVIAEELIAFRGRVAPVLGNLLSNTRAAAPTPERFAFQLPRKGTRVCDLAFILLQRMLHVHYSASAYFGMAPADRDKKIKEFQKSRPYRDAMQDEP